MTIIDACIYNSKSTVPQLALYIFKNAYYPTWSSILERKK